MSQDMCLVQISSGDYWSVETAMKLFGSHWSRDATLVHDERSDLDIAGRL